MLISEKLDAIIRILLVNHLEKLPKMRPKTLAACAGISTAMGTKLLLKLAKTKYISFNRGGISLVNPMKLIKAWSYSRSIYEQEKIEFLAAERPQYVMLKIANRAREIKLPYAFTLFSATEHISPYVAPSATHIYIRKKDIKSWVSLFNNQNILPAEGNGNVICYLVDENYFIGTKEIRDVSVINLAQLYVDLFSFGGRGEEAAEEIAKILIKGMQDV